MKQRRVRRCRLLVANHVGEHFHEVLKPFNSVAHSSAMRALIFLCSEDLLNTGVDCVRRWLAFWHRRIGDHDKFLPVWGHHLCGEQMRRTPSTPYGDDCAGPSLIRGSIRHR